MKLENDKKMIYDEWRERTRVQFGTSAAIFLTMASAALVFELNLMTKNDTHLCCYVHHLFKYSVIAYISSIISYVFFNLSRLCDFYKTQDLYGDGKEYEEVEKETRLIGKLTWGLFFLQIVSFVVGVILSIKAFYYLL